MSDNEEMAVEDQVEEPKKGRGRPNRVNAPKTKSDEKSEEPPVKRGRGRPPKDAAAKKAPKPKKQADGDAEDADKAPPKRRGRQPKAAAKEEAREESEEEAENGDEEEPAPRSKPKGGKAAGKKAAKNGLAKEKEDSEEERDESEKSDAASSDSRIRIVVEHCKSCQTYRRKAEEIIDALKEKWSNIEVEFNPTKPSKGAFEITLCGKSGKDVKLWSGLDLGPPRKLKFPEPEVVVEAMEKAYVPESA